ncbi:MAG: ferric reductase-like transmembrane domain-containing protein [Ekhidna sp.]|nr:ferric reductase-like transmembrane domain-containing protein [Ekhidna sp.]
MSTFYTSILWNKNKKRYDLAVATGVVSFIALFTLLNLILNPEVTFETNLLRSFGWLSILLLHIILTIGPLSRLNPAFNIVLYNRRHLGVIMFLLGLIHGAFSIMQFHALGNMNPIRSVFLSNVQYGSISFFPFQTLGFLGLLVLALMAASSHDFWLKNLGFKTWKALHMMVYVAYGLLLMHIVVGGLQNETSPVIFGIVIFGFLTIASLHLLSGLREIKNDTKVIASGDFIPICTADDIPKDRAKVFTISGERVAVFRYDGKLSAVNNVCRHQGGPLGEGKVINGCITCPWHGYQYLPESGQSPPPFTEKVETYHLKLEGDQVLINPNPNEPGTVVDPIKL